MGIPQNPLKRQTIGNLTVLYGACGECGEVPSQKTISDLSAEHAKTLTCAACGSSCRGGFMLCHWGPHTEESPGFWMIDKVRYRDCVRLHGCEMGGSAAYVVLDLVVHIKCLKARIPSARIEEALDHVRYEGILFSSLGLEGDQR